MERTQLVVIGAGPGGYAAAFHAAEHGAEVTLVDAGDRLGGVCLNVGCIPSKALLHVAKLIGEAREAAEWGVRFGEPEIDLAALRTFKEDVVSTLSGGIVDLCKRRDVRHVRARARFLDGGRLALEDPRGGSLGELGFEHAILASGSAPFVPPGLRHEDPRIMDSSGALELSDVPGRLLVVGGGYIGLELATVYAALGSRVTVVELLPEILAGADRDLVRPLAKRLAGRLEAIHLETKVASLEVTPAAVVATFEGETTSGRHEFDRVLVAVGRRPRSADLGLERTRVELDDKGFVRVDATRRTAEASIFAIGDVAGEPMLAHKAMHEGKVAADVILGRPAAFEPRAIPAVVFTDPEIAWCGVTEAEAKARGVPVEVARFPWAASGRARTLGRTEGLTKILADPDTERVLGVGIVGAGAGELIAEAVLAIEMGAVVEDLEGTIHPHPTLSETIGGSAEVLHGHATDLYRPRRRG